MKNTTVANVQVYTDLLENLVKEFEILPSGYLIIRGRRYHQRVNNKEYGITRQPNQVQLLARKRYVTVLIDEITKYLNTPLKSIHQFSFATHKEIIKSFPSTFQTLPDEYFQLSSLNTWLTQPFRANSNYNDSLIYPTKAGFMVRSKEEVILSNTLTDHNIPHKFEVPYQLKKKTIYPDFTIINPYTGKQFIWEHHGAFHLEKYGEQAHQKIIIYTQNGLLLNDTLIITYSSDIQKPRHLQEIIKTIILKI